MSHCISVLLVLLVLYGDILLTRTKIIPFYVYNVKTKTEITEDKLSNN